MKLSNEAKVGLMVTISFTIFIVMIGFLTKLNVSQSGYKLRVYYSFLSDLRVGAPVKLAGGIKIGQVEDIRQSGEKSEVILWIDNKYKMPKSSSFAIFTSGMIGEKYINVIVPALKTEEGNLRDGDVKYGIDPASFDQMMQTFQSVMQDKNGGELLAEIFKNSSNFVANLDAIAGENRDDIRTTVETTRSTMLTVSGQLKLLMEQLNSVAGNLQTITTKNQEDINITLKNISQTTDNLNKIIYRLESGKGTMGKLLTDEEIYYNLKDASIYAKDLFKQLSNDPSLLLMRQKKY